MSFAGSKILLSFLGNWFMSTVNLSESLNCRGLLFFSGAFIASTFPLRSFHSKAHTSPHLAIVPFRIIRKIADLVLKPAISWSISVSVGIQCIFRMPLISGGFQ
jgi:hypothetical protein